jgi:hypothetical protein
MRFKLDDAIQELKEKSEKEASKHWGQTGFRINQDSAQFGFLYDAVMEVALKIKALEDRLDRIEEKRNGS